MTKSVSVIRNYPEGRNYVKINSKTILSWMWDDIFQKLIRRNFLVEISPPENFGKRNYWVDIYHPGIKSPPQSLKVPHIAGQNQYFLASPPEASKCNISFFWFWDSWPPFPASQSAHFLGKPLLPPLKVPHFPGQNLCFYASPPEVSKCNISLGDLWFWDSWPPFPASQSAAFARETSPPLSQSATLPRKYLCF